ncbi:hypothetical protein ABEF91_007185 [Exophiala dermatitidis]
MEGPFRKRPRLSIFAGQESQTDLDSDLDALRYKNDSLLKSRFESIFAKYSQDFSGVGDEIDIVQQKIVVNNGHLESMEGETDTGEAPGEDDKGRSFLRAMTEAPAGADLGSDQEANGVLTSIEAIAENAALSDDEDDGDEDEQEDVHEDEVDCSPSEADEAHASAPVGSRHPDVRTPDMYGHSPSVVAPRGSYNKAQPDTNDSDNDSLFEVTEQQRSTSPDSLFEVGTRSISSGDLAPPPCSLNLTGDPEESAILEKYGPKMGQEVLELLHNARKTTVEAQVEPAWRLPPELVSPKRRREFNHSSPMSGRPSENGIASSELEDVPVSDPRGSFWRSSVRKITPQFRRPSKRLRKVRQESVDPLQGEISGDQNGEGETVTTPVWKEESDNAAVVWKSNRPNARGSDEQVLQMKKGICFYCSRQWKTRASVFRHWTDLLREAEAIGVYPDDVHDMIYIRDYYLNAPTDPRGPRMSVSNLRRLVELHEGKGLSFDEIARSGLLRSKKRGTQLKEAYVTFRKRRESRAKGAVREWSEEELEALNRLCENPETEIGVFARNFANRTTTDVVDKLAEIWLAAFGESVNDPAPGPRTPEPQSEPADNETPTTAQQYNSEGTRRSSRLASR